ncbi:sialic acid TRAP transporter substrate-binding protein SiaP [Tritonibacter horizontis]|uniref:Sialic acid-binding periplasmic protein SiaP n=1 Tax=Tritonibacter horizontis TaxID=1768241 RepID=A0A132BT93_9RHOB|nr:sialic acid TRAP transporter substrate-binding protein SiaP [Tritonibacter horizontis]KUP91601.1 sialic acid-binding periplasmic protein SiaP precursor [Tritonibacter horizontis]
MKLTRTLAAFAMGTALVAPVQAAADPIEIKYTTASVPSDLHTRAMQVFKDELEARAAGAFDVQLFDSGSLFAQGADLDALQRGNAEMTYLSYQLIADAIPEYSLLTAGYLFQNPAHYRTFLASDIGAEFKAKVSEEMDVQLLDTCYLGTRQLNLRKARDVQTPADLDGLKLRMPGSDAWLFLGSALGAAPTPLPFGEVYLGLQTGTIDAQDNPLPTVEAAKFYEVTKQIVLTSHLVDGINIAINNETWDKLSDDQKTAVSEAAVASCDWNNAERTANEERLVDFLTSEGLQVVTPDVDAFRTHVQDVYFSSERSKSWPEGWVEQINAMAE